MTLGPRTIELRYGYSPYRELVRCRRRLYCSVILNVILGLLLLVRSLRP